MSFLVTGATGFIGKHVVNNALRLRHEVKVVTRDVEMSRAIFGHKVQHISAPEFFHNKAKLNGDEKVIHLAWEDVSNYMDAKNFDENLAIQKRFIDSFLKYGLSDLTIAGTCLEYGLREGKCSESNKVEGGFPTSYAKLKTELYGYLKSKKKEDDNINIKWLRFFYLYGVGSRSKSLLSLLLKAIKDGDEVFNMSLGDQKRDFINVDTLSYNVVKIAEQNEVTGIINIGNGKPRSVEEFVETIKQIKGSDIKLNKGYYDYPTYEAKDFWADTSKLKKVKGVRFDEDIWL